MHTYITPAQFDCIKPFFPSVKTTRPKKYSDYELLNGLLYILRTGSQWRNLPCEYPPWKSVYWFWKKLQISRTMMDRTPYTKHIFLLTEYVFFYAQYFSQSFNKQTHKRW